MRDRAVGIGRGGWRAGIAVPAVNVPADGLVRVTFGGAFAGAATFTSIAADVTTPPALSYARAASVCVPTAPAAHVAVDGAAVSSAITLPSTRNSTWVTVASASDALAARTVLTPVVTVVPVQGSSWRRAGARQSAFRPVLAGGRHGGRTARSRSD